MKVGSWKLEVGSSWFYYVIFTIYYLLPLPSSVFAEGKVAGVSAIVLQPGGADFFTKSVIVAAIGLAIAAAFAAIGQGLTIGKALEGIARQPEAGGQLQLNMIIGLAFIESLVLYVLFISIILLFANPFMKYFVQ